MSLDLLVIGASAGGFEALREVFGRLPADFELPIAVVMHIRQGVDYDLGLLFRAVAERVSEAKDKEKILPGKIYFAPSGYHLLIERDLTFSLSVDEKVSWARPSIDVLFETAATALGEKVAGLLLTGANSDGATGLAAIAAAGGATFVQDPSTAMARAMPEAGINACPGASVDNLAGLTAAIARRCAADTARRRE